MTTSSHDHVMKVTISGLEARLGAYIDAVRRGKTVIVLDRKTPVARLAPLREADDAFQVLPASRSPREIGKTKGVRPKKPVDVVEVLAESRGDR